jgi:hypothetical protein
MIGRARLRLRWEPFPEAASAPGELDRLIGPFRA